MIAVLEIWEDAPQSLNNNDRLYIPVDTVIIEIFKRIGFDRCNFDTINKEVAKYYHGEAIEVWDDLWFWGFITQRRSGNQRTLGWNPNKYWSLENSNKDEIIITEIKEKAEHFLKLLF